MNPKPYCSSARPVPAWIDVTNGSLSPESQAPGMSAVTQLTLGGQLPAQADKDEYYSASLWMLTHLAKDANAR